jgi:hypothetical protein
MTRILLHVDRLVLRGMGSADVAALTSGLQAELAARWGADGPHPVPGPDAPQRLAARVAGPADAGTAGRAIARCVVRGAGR